MQPDIGLLRHLSNVTSETGNAKANVMDALILAIHVLVEEYGRLRYSKQIVLITDAVDPIHWRDAADVKAMLQKEDIKLVVIGSDFDADGIIKHENEDATISAIKDTNQRNWKTLSDNVDGATMYSIEEAYESAKGMKTKEVKPTPSYRGFLNIGDPVKYSDRSLAIGIHMYPHMMEAKAPAMKKWSTLSDLALDNDQAGSSSSEPRTLSHGVEMIRQYRVKEDDTSKTETPTPANLDTQEPQQDATDVVDENELEKVYPFGKTLVKITQEEEDYLQLKTSSGMWIYGFMSKSAVPRHYLLGRVYVIMADPKNKESAGMAIAALARSLYEKEAVALVRYVHRGNSEPKMGIISPFIDVDVDLLQFCQIPYAEDVRQFYFKSLDKITMKSGKVITEDNPLLPTPEMKQSMATYVKNMDLTSVEDHDHYVPEDTFNPLIWRTNTAIKTRALNEAAPIPEVHPKLLQSRTVPKELETRNADHVKEMVSLFNVKKAEKQIRSKRGRGAAGKGESIADTSQMTPIDELVAGSDSKRAKTEDNGGDSTSSKTKQLSIGPADPVKDFLAMLADEQDLVTAAVTQMSALILQLMKTSFGDQHYDRIMTCLKVFREAAAKENEAGAFNQCLHQLKEMINPANPRSNRREFWQMLQKESLSLITKDEAEDDEVTLVTKDDAINVSLHSKVSYEKPTFYFIFIF
ncbi:unnamed protein product [Absidia cylindrospora]